MTAYHEVGDALGKSVSLLVSPLAGLAYVIALPFVSIAAAGALLTMKVFEGSFIFLSNFVSFGWRPAEASLGGRTKKRKTQRHPTD